MIQWMLIGIQLVLVLALMSLIVRLCLVIFFARRHLPFLPSSRRAMNAMFVIPAWSSARVVMDLGSGTGTILARIRRTHPSITTIGVEHSLLLVLVSRLRFLLSRRRPRIIHGSFFNTTVAPADIIVGFWITDLMPSLLKKFEEECRPGTTVISNLFRLPSSPKFRESSIPVGTRHRIWVYERR